MNELIKINYETEQPTISARDLHEGLEIKSNFTTWFERMNDQKELHEEILMLIRSICLKATITSCEIRPKHKMNLVLQLQMV